MQNRRARPPVLLLYAPATRSDVSGLGELCTRFGFRVEEVSDPTALVAAAHAVAADLVVYDAAGASDPAATCAEIAAGIAPPLVVLDDERELERVLAAGAADALPRAFDPGLLAARIARECDRARTAADRDRALGELAACKSFAGLGEWSLDRASDRLACSPALEPLFGWRAGAEARTRASLVAAVAPADRGRFEACLERTLVDPAPATIEHDLATPGFRVRQRIASVAGPDGHPGRLVGLVRAVEPVTRPERRLHAVAAAEGLAGFADRAQFLERVASAIGAAQPPRDQVAVLLIQFDFDSLPDCFAGGESRQVLLGLLAQRMRESIRDRDLLGHLGSQMRDVSIAHVGDARFTILVPGIARSHDAYKAARRIHDALAEPLSLEGVTCAIPPSLGIAMYPADGASPTALLEAAEAAVLAANGTGHAAIQFYTAAMNASAFERLTLETSLRLALERDELLVHYQPKIEIATGRISGFEALVRWKHPDLGLVSPAQFIPIAEETGLIVPIGEHVLRVACEQNKRWQDDGLPPVRMAVNLSSVQFRDPAIAATVARILDEVGLAPEWLELELTESILLQKAETTIASLRQLKKTGIRLSIDDFGTGYSSLSYLKRFPIDTLKIDQSFIREVTSNPEDASITTSIILMGKSLNLHVVAEGVETQSQLAFLKVLECDEAQGYLFSRPVPAEQAGELLATSVGNYG